MATHDAAASPTPGRGTLVGRDHELSVLEACITTAGSGRPALALVLGEAGIGKTRLADEAVALARAADVQILRGEADPSSREPMELWRGVHRALDLEPFNDPSLPAEERRWDHLESLADALATKAPAIVVLEDLHWADPTAVWVLEHLPRALGTAPVAFVATSRDREPDMPRLDELLRVARVIPLVGLDVEAVGRLAGEETGGSVDAAALHARTGGNPLFVKELVRTPDGSGVIGEVLDRSLGAFDPDVRGLLATAAAAGPATPLAIVARASGIDPHTAGDRLAIAEQHGVLAEVSTRGVRFRHALVADAALRLGDPRDAHRRLADAWAASDGLDARAAAASHRLRAASGTPAVAEAVEAARSMAAELVASGQDDRAAALLQAARELGAECVDRPDLRADVALDLAEVLSWPGDLEPASSLYQEAADLARDCDDPVTRARAALGADLWVAAFVPDPPRVRMLELALEQLPSDERRIRTQLLWRLTVVGGADPDATERVHEWAAEAVAVARASGDPVLLSQSLLNQTMSPTSRAELDEILAAAEEVVRLAEHAGRTDLALNGHQRCAGHHLDRGDLSAANHSLGRAELLAELLPTPVWRQRTMVQRTTLLALAGSHAAASAEMYAAAETGIGHTEPVVLIGCEMLHQLMLLDLFGHAEPRAEEVFRISMEIADAVPSPVLQVTKGFGAQLFGDDAAVQDVLARYGDRPELLLRSMTGEHLLRVLGDTIARAGVTARAGAAYRALLPFAGLLNVGGGHSAGLPVDDVLGRLAALDGDVPGSVRHATDAVALARSMPSPPLLVHCLDHLADAVERAGAGELDPSDLRKEADALADTMGIRRPDRSPGAAGSSWQPAPNASMRRDAGSWVFTTPLGDARVADSNGAGQLARLLSAPGVEISALELAGRAAAPAGTDLGPSLDARAKRAYRQRLLELQSEIDDADGANDPVSGERAQAEMDSLVRELRRAIGLGGRDRPTGSEAERSRVNVVRSLRRAIAAVADQAPLLGAHLDGAVRTGGRCLYLPDPAAGLVWSVDAGGA